MGRPKKIEPEIEPVLQVEVLESSGDIKISEVEIEAVPEVKIEVVAESELGTCPHCATNLEKYVVSNGIRYCSDLCVVKHLNGGV